MTEILRKFGRIESPPDPRDFELDDFMPKRFRVGVGKGVKWDFPCTALDQKDTPHCVGFAMAHFGINLPTWTVYTKEDAHRLYYKCKEKDGEPGRENGTTLRSAAKVLQDIGAINAYAFARTVDQIKWWLRNRGPVIVGILWTEDMMRPDEDNVLNTGGFFVGGHGFIINEITEDDLFFGLKNSWGPNWGINGKAYISVKDFTELFMYGGEALAAVELENYRQERLTFLEKIIKALGAFFKDFWRLMKNRE